MHFFRAESWSIDGNAGSGRFSGDLLYGLSNADGSEAGRPESEIEGTGVGAAVGGNHIFLVHGKDECKVAIWVEHQTDMVQLDAAVTQVLPDSEADVSTSGRQKRVLKFSSIRVPGLKGFEKLKGSWWSWWYHRDGKRT